MRRITDSPWAAVTVGLLLLLGSYVGAYLTLVRRAITSKREYATGEIEREFLPYYHGNYEILESLFTPVHVLDRKLRSGYWHSITKPTSGSVPKPSP